MLGALLAFEPYLLKDDPDASGERCHPSLEVCWDSLANSELWCNPRGMKCSDLLQICFEVLGNINELGLRGKRSAPLCPRLCRQKAGE